MTRRRFGQVVLKVFLAAFTSMACYADEADNLSLVTAFNASGHDLLKQFVAMPGNVVFSPYSIGSAMTMALSGAQGDTANEMASVLHQGLDRDRMDAANAIILNLLKGADTSAAVPRCPVTQETSFARPCETIEPQIKGPTKRPYERSSIVQKPANIRIANAVMLTKEAVVSDAYIKRMEENYAAKVFRNARIQDINGWVKLMTEGKIDTILDRPVTTGVVLIDAIYFKQAWQKPFAAGETKNDDFHLSPMSSVT